MSRSYRKTPAFPNTNCVSEADEKAIWHRRWRRKERIVLAGADADKLEAHQPTHRFQFSDPWLMPKDGKSMLTKTDLDRAADIIAERKISRQKANNACQN